MSSETETAGLGSRALERGLLVLGLFSPQEKSFSVREISKRTGFPIATTYRLVRSLLQLGYLDDKRGTGDDIQLGLEIVRLAAVANASNTIISVGQEELRRLATSTGETTVLLVPGEWTALCVGVIVGESPIRPRSALAGEGVPYNGGATPMTLLAFASVDFRSRILASGLDQYTSQTLTDPSALEMECARIRQQGFAWSDSAFIEGTGAYAAPIFDIQGRIAGSIGVTGLTENVRHAGDAVIESAARATLRLGGTP